MTLLRIFLCMLSVFAALSPQACATTYSAEPIEAWVVDADSGQPVEGVVVTANWQLVSGSLAGGEIPKGQLRVMETVTDRSGRFYFEGWTKGNLTTAELRNQDPQILMFKPGYKFYRFVSDYPISAIPLGSHRKSAISGRTIQLEKYRGTSGDSRNFSQLNYELGHIIDTDGTECEWKNFPKMLAAVQHQETTFRKSAVVEFSSIAARLRQNEKFYLEKGCESPNEFLRGLDR